MIPNKFQGLYAPHEEWENLLPPQYNRSFHSPAGVAGLTHPPQGIISPREKKWVNFDPQEVFQKSHLYYSASEANVSWVAWKIPVNNQGLPDRITGLTCFFWEWEMKLDRKGEEHPDSCLHPGEMIWQIIWIGCVLNRAVQRIPQAKKNRKYYVIKKICLLEWVHFSTLFLATGWWEAF